MAEPLMLLRQEMPCGLSTYHKKKEYTGDNIDRLSAFKIAAALQNCDPKAALAGMMSKHVVSLYDMCYSLCYILIWNSGMKRSQTASII